MLAASMEFSNQQGEDMPIAGLYVAIRANGDMVSKAVNIEPEHVPPLIEELRRMMDEMREFAAKSRLPIKCALIYAATFAAAAYTDSVLFPAIARAL